MELAGKNSYEQRAMGYEPFYIENEASNSLKQPPIMARSPRLIAHSPIPPGSELNAGVF